MNSLKESILYYSFKVFGMIFRTLPQAQAYRLGRFAGRVGYFLYGKRTLRAYANIKQAFAATRPPEEIRRITRDVFVRYGESFVDLFRLPKINKDNFRSIMTVEGEENIRRAMEQGRGVIFLAMHYGSWEMASMSCTLLDFPYKMMARPQKKYTRLDALLQEYRSGVGTDILLRGSGTKDFLKSLKQNKVVGMVVDQGGKDGVLVPFFGRDAKMAVGAIRMGLKWKVPICFSIIQREKNGRLKMIIQEPLRLKDTGNLEEDLMDNLKAVIGMMESYIRQRPEEYMWFYKIWKYSNEAQVMLLTDGKAGHFHQAQQLSRLLRKKMDERKIVSEEIIVSVVYRGAIRKMLFFILTKLFYPIVFNLRIDILKFCLTEESFRNVMGQKVDYVVSCGTQLSCLNKILADDNLAHSVIAQKPGWLPVKAFDFVVLPEHDRTDDPKNLRVVVTKGALNLINQDYLEQMSRKLMEHFSHLKHSHRVKIGLLIGGDSRKVYLKESQIRILVEQVKEAARALQAEILVTTSRRTPTRIEKILNKDLKFSEECALFISPNNDDVPEAFGGILGLCDILIVSGDSISMISESATSGKQVIVFAPEVKPAYAHDRIKHLEVINRLHDSGYILCSDVRRLSQAIMDLSKNKIHTRPLDDNKRVLEKIHVII